MSCKFNSTASHAGCKQGNGSDLKCKNTVCDGNKRCATSSVIDIWRAAGFEDLIVTGRTVMKRICILHKTYTALIAKKSWTENSKTKLSKQEEDYIKESDELFDISLPDFFNKIEKDRMRDKDAKKEDIEFFNDQRNARKMYIDLAQPDMNLDSAIKRQKYRQDRDNYKGRHIDFSKMEESSTKYTVIDSSDESDGDAIVGDDSSSDDSGAEKLERSFSRTPQSKSKGEKPKVKILIIIKFCTISYIKHKEVS